jgi:beta-1,4-mannosyl-glycoprotein beta-1,4-N-acetylglucosaminyltransferase
MIIDAFCFYNELDLLQLRLNELSGVVDRFILVEAVKTQSLLPKPLYFAENKERFAKYLHKIVHVVLEDCPSNDGNNWRMEHFQRTDGYKKGLERLDLKDTDFIHASDMDEIPRAKALQYIVNNDKFQEIGVCVLDLNFYAYFMNLKAAHRNWVGGSVTKAPIFLKHDPHFFTDNRESLPRVLNAGWHFSWLGGAEKVYEKSFACIEPYDKSAIPPKEEYIKHFNEHFKKEKKTFIHIENLSKEGIEFIQTPFDESYPVFIKENFQNFQKYFI